MRSTRIRVLLAATALSAVLASPAYAGTVNGRVIDGSGTAALKGARVTVVELNRSAESGPGGEFRFVNLPAGTYTLRTSYAGADTVDVSLTVAADGEQSIDIPVGPGADAFGESVLVVGQRANLASSISRQRNADGVESVLTRDSIGQFPDQNVAESLRRAPGINVLNDQGEGRFVSVRGLDPNLNSSSINGARIPAPEADVSSVALDVIPSELIESIEIKKSLTPDMDADTIGAQIEINTTSALDRETSLITATVEGSYNDLNGKTSPKASVDFSTRIGNVGVAGGLSYYKRSFSTDNIESEGWDITDDGVLFADTLEYRDYDVERIRTGGTLSLDYRVDADTTLFARLLHSRFEDQEYRTRLIFEMDGAPASGSATSATFLSDDGEDDEGEEIDNNEIAVIRDIKDRYEVQNISSFVAGGKTFSGPWTFEYQGSYAKASEKERGSLDPVEFARGFDEPGDLSVTFDYSDLERPTYSIGTGLDAFLDPSEYEFDKIERTALSLSEEEEITFKADITRDIALDEGELEIQFGAKARLRDKSYDLELEVLEGIDATLADVLGSASYGLANIDPVPGPNGVRRFFNANRNGFELDTIDSDFESAAEDYSVSEDIFAGYLLARYENGPLRAIGGVRIEHTQVDVAANLVELIEEGGTRNGVELDEDTVFVTPTSFSKEYTDYLPSIGLRYEATSDIVLRAAAFRSVVRPKVGDIAPRFIVEENDEGDREGAFGNPDLEPYKAWNYDLSAEWYFDRNAVIQAGVFYKTIENFIVVAAFEDITFNSIAASEAEIPINGEEATVMGFEFNYQQSLDDLLPEPFDGFLVGFNYTYTDAEGDVIVSIEDGVPTESRSIPLPSASKNTFNATLGYEKGPWNIRLAATYRDKYLDELGGSAEEDRYVKDHIQYDLSAKYRVDENFQLFAELINIGDEPYVAYQPGPGADRLLQYEEYSYTVKFGVKANY
jgi:TonB-dependent receptor